MPARSSTASATRCAPQHDCGWSDETAMNAPPSGLPRVRVDPRIDLADDRGVRGFYVNSDVQPFQYEEGPAAYAGLIAETVASCGPRSVLEFGCGSGRNLAV